VLTEVEDGLEFIDKSLFVYDLEISNPKALSFTNLDIELKKEEPFEGDHLKINFTDPTLFLYSSEK